MAQGRAVVAPGTGSAEIQCSGRAGAEEIRNGRKELSGSAVNWGYEAKSLSCRQTRCSQDIFISAFMTCCKWS